MSKRMLPGAGAPGSLSVLGYQLRAYWTPKAVQAASP